MKTIFKLSMVMLLGASILVGCNGGSKKEKAAQAKAAVNVENMGAVALTDVLTFLQSNPPFFISTIEDNAPRVRPFSFVMEYEGKLCFATSKDKSIFAQIAKNPNVELCASSSKGEWIRVRGIATVLDDIKAKEKAFEQAPYLVPLYQGPTNPHFIMYYIANGTASFNTSDGNAPRLVGF